jgi:hypothetical protein
MKKPIRKKKAVDVQKGHFVSVHLNDGQRAGFYLGATECERFEGRLENDTKNDASRFFEVDTVSGGVLVLNLGPDSKIRLNKQRKDFF